MLHEVRRVQQRSDEPHRRWFVDERMELTAWQDDDDRLVAFQLGYRQGGAERVLTWRRGGGLTHDAVDDGELPAGRYKQTPIMVPDGAVPWRRLYTEFRWRARRIDRAIAAAVARVLAGEPT